MNVTKIPNPPPPWYVVEARLRRLERYTVAIAIALFLVALFASGCTGVTLVREHDGDAIGDARILSDEVMEACAILGLICEPATKSYGAISLDIVDTHDHVQGLTLDSSCRPVSRSTRDPLTIAHEFGHALDLDHVDVVDNIMYPGRHMAGDDLTDEQLDTVQDAARLLDGCRP